MDALKPPAVIPWFMNVDSYLRIRSASSDPQSMPFMYSEWLQRAQEKRNEARRRGYPVIQVPIQPSKFLDWCLHNGLNVDARARLRFATETAWVYLQNARDGKA